MVLKILKRGIRLALIPLAVSAVVLSLAPLLIPPGRFVIFANHSDQHAGFVYRLLMMPVLAVNLTLAKKSAGEKTMR